MKCEQWKPRPVRSDWGWIDGRDKHNRTPWPFTHKMKTHTSQEDAELHATMLPTCRTSYPPLNSQWESYLIRFTGTKTGSESQGLLSGKSVWIAIYENLKIDCPKSCSINVDHHLSLIHIFVVGDIGTQPKQEFKAFRHSGTTLHPDERPSSAHRKLPYCAQIFGRVSAEICSTFN